MQNFGKGMWRRIGDYGRIISPQIERNEKILQYLLHVENLKRQQQIKQYRQYVLKNVNSTIIVEENNESNSDIKFEEITEANEVIEEITEANEVIEEITEANEVIIVNEVVNESEEIITNDISIVKTPIAKKNRKRNKKANN